MPNKEKATFLSSVCDGLYEASDNMLVDKAKKGENVVISDDNGNIIIESARDILDVINNSSLSDSFSEPKRKR